MKLVERHIITKQNKLFKEIDTLAFLSKNLYNAANYLIRQEFINNNKYLSNSEVYHLIKASVDYKALPAKVSNQVLRVLERNWKSFLAASREFKINPKKFLGKPKLPKYKDKIKGRNIVIYELGALSKPGLRNGLVKLSKTNISMTTKQKEIKEVRLVPRCSLYVIEIVYEVVITNTDSAVNSKIAAIDLGIDNLATVSSNAIGFKPLIINGKPIKSVNQFYNKKKAKLQQDLQKQEPKRYVSNRINTLTAKRNHKIETYLHQASRTIINYLLQNQIGTLVIGNNKEWKQNINIGKTNNQNFVQLPHYKFIQQLAYKAELARIKVIVNEESYTSRASFLDLDDIPTYKAGEKHNFSGKRIKRGMYKSAKGLLINADLNGSYNILRKVVPNAFEEGNRGTSSSPIQVHTWKSEVVDLSTF